MILSPSQLRTAKNSSWTIPAEGEDGRDFVLRAMASQARDISETEAYYAAIAAKMAKARAAWRPDCRIR